MASRNSESDYPPGPITCCLQCIGKEIKVREDTTWSVSLIICWVSSVIAFLLYLVAFGTVGWAKTMSLQVGDGSDIAITRMIGLWQECHSVTGCGYIDSSGTSGGFKAAQAFAVLSLVGIIAGAVLTIGYSFSTSSRLKDRMGMGALVTRFITFLTLLLVIPLFAQSWGTKFPSSENKKKLEYSFILTVVTFILEAIGVLFTYTDVIVLSRNRTKLLHTSVDDGYSNEGFTEGSQNSIYPGGVNINPDSNRSSVNRLGELIQGHMNAKAAYEQFSQNDQEVKSVPPPPPSLRASRDSLFRDPSEIEKRFTGITLAEPVYNPLYGSQSTLATINQPEEPIPKVQKGRRNMAGSKKPEEWHQPTLTVPDGQENAGPGHPGGQMKPSISLQNIYQGNAPVQLSPTGKPITSVSMYNLYEEVNNGLSAFNSNLAIPDTLSMASEQYIDGQSVASQPQGTPRRNMQGSKSQGSTTPQKQKRQRTPKTKKQFSLSRENLIRELANEDSVSRVSMSLPPQDMSLHQPDNIEMSRFPSRSRENLSQESDQGYGTVPQSRENVSGNISRGSGTPSRTVSPHADHSQYSAAVANSSSKSLDNISDSQPMLQTKSHPMNRNPDLPNSKRSRSQENLAAGMPLSIGSSSHLAENSHLSKSRENMSDIPMSSRSKSQENLTNNVPLRVRSKSQQNLTEAMPFSVQTRAQQNLAQNVPLSTKTRSQPNLAQDAPLSIRSMSNQNLTQEVPMSIRSRSHQNLGNEPMSVRSNYPPNPAPLSRKPRENLHDFQGENSEINVAAASKNKPKRTKKAKPEQALDSNYPNPLYDLNNQQALVSQSPSYINATDEQKQHYAKLSDTHPERNKKAPARKKKDQRLATSCDNLSGTPMSRAHSTLSLHSITSMVAGAAETEI